MCEFSVIENLKTKVKTIRKLDLCNFRTKNTSNSLWDIANKAQSNIEIRRRQVTLNEMWVN